MNLLYNSLLTEEFLPDSLFDPRDVSQAYV